MDRNYVAKAPYRNIIHVALRKESVDRNNIKRRDDIKQFVALRKESVDRNILKEGGTFDPPLSLSARRAWIEIR